MDTIVVTPEERAASNKYKSIRRGYCKEAMTEEEKALHRSFNRKAYARRTAAMTEKEYEAFLDRARKYYWKYRKSMTPEQEAEYKRKHRENANAWNAIPENRERRKQRNINKQCTRREQAKQTRESFSKELQNSAIDKYEAEKAAFFEKLERGEYVWYKEKN